MSQRILVIPMSKIGADEVDTAIGGRFGDDAEVHVVAPASGLSRLDWLTNAEDDARADAADRADAVAEALPGDDVAAEAGDVDPLLAIEDALRTFPADQIVVLTKGKDEASWLEGDAAAKARERFVVPITHLVVS
jgi:hypothetical protein